MAKSRLGLPKNVIMTRKGFFETARSIIIQDFNPFAKSKTQVPDPVDALRSNQRPAVENGLGLGLDNGQYRPGLNRRMRTPRDSSPGTPVTPDESPH